MAFFLVVLCAIPLFYPHGYMLRAERGYLKTVQLDKAVDLVYAHLLQQLYENQIDWDQLAGSEWMEIDKALYRTPLPFKGSYRFHYEGDQEEGKGRLYSVDMRFTSLDDSKAAPLLYRYDVAIKRQPLDGSPQDTGKQKEPPKSSSGDEETGE
jgi:hypothetical protein